jgi:hypothetical protein
MRLNWAEFKMKRGTANLSMVLSLAMLALGAAGAARASDEPTPAALARYIVQSASMSFARETVVSAGGRVVAYLDVVHGVSAELTAAQVAKLRADPRIHLFADRSLND